MSDEAKRVELLVGRVVEEIHRLIDTPELAYKVAIGALLKVLQAYNYLIPTEDVKRLARRAEVKLDPSCGPIPPVNDTARINELVNELLDTLENGDAGLSAEAIDRLSKYVIEPTDRTSGIIIDDANKTERYDIRMPVMSTNLSNQVMDLVERLGNGGWHVDKQAWDHLLIYIPKYQKLKKRFKRFKRFFGKI